MNDGETELPNAKEMFSPSPSCRCNGQIKKQWEDLARAHREVMEQKGTYSERTSSITWLTDCNPQCPDDPRLALSVCYVYAYASWMLILFLKCHWSLGALHHDKPQLHFSKCQSKKKGWTEKRASQIYDCTKPGV